MVKSIIIRISEGESSKVDDFVRSGLAKSRADFVKTAMVLRMESEKNAENRPATVLRLLAPEEVDLIDEKRP